VIKKFVSDALLSIVMDKSAREKLAKQRGQEAPATPAGPNPLEQSPLDRASDAAEDLAMTIEMALADARAESGANPKPMNRPRAKAPQPAEPAKPMTPEREQLIRDAISIHRQKTRMLDELDPQMREKLTVMAMMALDPGSLPGGGKKTGESGAGGGPVDEIGSARKLPKKRR